MKPVVFVFTLIVLMMSFCLTAPAGATMVELNNGINQYNRNSGKTIENMFWIQDLNLFINQTYSEQQQTISGLSIKWPWKNWWMATEGDINTLAHSINSNMDNFFIPAFTINHFDDTDKYLYNDIEWRYDNLYSVIKNIMSKNDKSWNKYTDNIILKEYYPINYFIPQSRYNYELKKRALGNWVAEDTSGPLPKGAYAYTVMLLFCVFLGMVAPESDERKINTTQLNAI